jgi:hypothetical protein
MFGSFSINFDDIRNSVTVKKAVANKFGTTGAAKMTLNGVGVAVLTRQNYRRFYLRRVRR